MADNDQLLQQIRKVVREENEPIKQELGEHKTILEALKAGQDDIREQLATKADKADVLAVGVKVDKLRKRIEGIEEHTGSSTHKN